MKKRYFRLLTVIICLTAAVFCAVPTRAASMGEMPSSPAQLSVSSDKEFVPGDECTGYAVPLAVKPKLFAASKAAVLQSSHVPTEQEAYNIMIGMKASYPEGMTYTNDNFYQWNGGIWYGGYGCAGFCFMLSDQIFGNTMCRQIYDVSIADLHVGDFLRVNGDQHSVSILEVHDDYVVLAEGNYGGKIHWGRNYTAREVADADYLVTRYPEGYFESRQCITFYDDLGMGGPTVQYFSKDTMIKLSSAAPTHPFFTFEGWALSPTSSVADYKPGDRFMASKSTRLYAVWSASDVKSIENSFPCDYSIDIKSYGDCSYYRFVPADTAEYCFESKGRYDPKISILNSIGSQIAHQDDIDTAAHNYNYSLKVNLEAGKTYFIENSLYSGTGSFVMTVSKEGASAEDPKEIVQDGLTYTVLSPGEVEVTACSARGDIVIPETVGKYTVTKLGYKLFYGVSGITSISIPATVKAPDYYDYVFSYCFDLKAITVSPDNPELCSVDGVLFTKDMSFLYTYPCSKAGESYETPAETTELCCTSFAGQEYLRTLVLTNTDVSWATYTFYGDSDLIVYYHSGGGCENSVISHRANGLSKESNTLYPEFVSIYVPEPVHLQTPELISVSVVSKGLEIKWSPVAEAKNYIVLKSFDGTNWEEAGMAASGKTSFVFTDIIPGVKYKFTVKCVSEDKLTDESDFDVNGLEGVFFSKPVVESASEIAGGVKLCWLGSEGVPGYRIFRKVGNGSWKTLANVEGTYSEYVDRTVKSGNRYAYTVRCLDNNHTDYLSMYDKNGKAVDYLGYPVINSLSEVNGGVKVTWDTPEGAAYMGIYRKTAETGWKKLGDVNNYINEYVDTKALPGETYIYTLKALGSSKEALTAYDKAGKTITVSGYPIISSVSVSSGGVKLSWDAFDGAAYIRVFRKTPGSKWKELDVITGESTGYTDKKAISGKTYVYTIRALGPSKENLSSSYDKEGVSINYTEYPVINEVMQVNGGVKLSWDLQDGASYIRVFRKTGSEKWKQISDVSGMETEYTDSTAKVGVTYTYTIKCLGPSKENISKYDTVGKTITVY